MATTLNIDLDSPLPSGAWTLYFHPAKENRWHMSTFKEIAKIKTYRDLANVFAAISPTDWARSKFFFTPDGIPPLFENYQNIRGGSYSLRVDRGLAGEYMQKYLLSAVLKSALTTPGDVLQCVRIKPQRDFNILQVWNKDCQTFNNPNGLIVIDSKIGKGEIKYCPHVEKKI